MISCKHHCPRLITIKIFTNYCISRSGINEQAKLDRETIGQSAPRPEVLNYIEEEDYEAGIKLPIASVDSDEEFEAEIDEKGVKKAKIEPLSQVDHSQISYTPFKKCFYKESDTIKNMSAEEVSKYRKEIEVYVTPYSAPRPIQNFSQAGFDKMLLEEIRCQGYKAPTPIQAQAIPIALSGIDVLGLARTGSGKTLAYVWPMIVHVMHQPQMELGDGPIGLVLSPTRELATQIYSETKRFAKVYNIRVVAVLGGSGKWEMAKALKEAPEIVVATPGRFIDMVRSKATHLTKCTMVVLDEADRMFDMGFEYQMRSIVNSIRPDRQVLMFSATMKKRIEAFAKELLQNEVRIVIGTIGQANADIHQLVEMVRDETRKWVWLAENIDNFAAEGKVLIFVLSKIGTEEVALKLKQLFAKRQLDINVDCLHGDRDQSERSKVMHAFCKTNTLPILVATDIAARGVDVKDIRTVINYDVAKSMETYVHRIGRTGRMGIEGVKPGRVCICIASPPREWRLTTWVSDRHCVYIVDEQRLFLCCRSGPQSTSVCTASVCRACALGVVGSEVEPD
jgi:ATP-dependent RNA helicase DDX42